MIHCGIFYDDVVVWMERLSAVVVWFERFLRGKRHLAEGQVEEDFLSILHVWENNNSVTIHCCSPDVYCYSGCEEN